MTSNLVELQKLKKDCMIPVRLSREEKLLFIAVFGEGKVSSALRILALRQATAHVFDERKPDGL